MITESEGNTMKKIKGTRYAHIGTSYNPTLEEKIATLEKNLTYQNARMIEMIEQVKRMIQKP